MVILRKIIREFGEVLTSHVEDFLILIGLAIIAITTFMLNVIAGLYITGLMVLLLGIYFAFNPIKRGGE